MVNRIKVSGQINTMMQTAFPHGKGWVRNSRTGLWTKTSSCKNTVVLAGLSAMFKWMQYGHADQGGSLRYIAVGTGYTTPAKAQTALVAELLRVAVDSWDNTNIASDPVVMIASRLFLTSEANGALMECGLFQNSSGAPMFCRGLFGTGAIADITQANPAVLKSYSHGLVDGDKILIENVDGMTEINDNAFYINKLTDHTVALYTDEDLTAAVDSSAYGAYAEASPGDDTWKKIIPKTSAETLTVTYSLSAAAA